MYECERAIALATDLTQKQIVGPKFSSFHNVHHVEILDILNGHIKFSLRGFGVGYPRAPLLLYESLLRIPSSTTIES